MSRFKFFYTSFIFIIFTLSLNVPVSVARVFDATEECIETPQEEINLEPKSLSITKNETELKEDNASKLSKAKTFLEKFHEGITFEEGPVNYFKMGILYGDEISISKKDEQMLGSNYTLPVSELYTKTIFNDKKYEIDTMYNFARNLPGHDNYVSEKISVLSLTRNIGAHQKIIIGQNTRLPIGVDGKYSGFSQDFVEKSQIGRTFSNVRSMGVRYQGCYKYADYDIGLYDSTRYSQDFFNGLDSTGWINFKPLAANQKYGSLILGTGYNVGHYNNDYSVLGTYIEYNYKKIHSKSEFSHANGYNSVIESTNNAEGFYTALLYDLTKKIQLTARYDCFNPNKHLHNTINTEYTAGLIYKPYENFKIFLNYIYKDKATAPCENKVMMSTSFYF